jgi:hypothetical protein
MNRRRKRIICNSFLPTAYSNAKLWLDASDSDTLPASGLVENWLDKTSFASNASQSTSSRRPTTGATTFNGRNVVDFDGSNVMTVANESIFDSQQFTLFVVGSGSGSFTGKCDPATITTDVSRRKLQLKQSEFVSGPDGTNVNFGTTALELRGVVSRGNSDHTLIDAGVISLDTTTLVTDNPNNVALEIGAAFGSVAEALTGSIAEIIYLDIALDNNGANSFINYFNNKWGLS